MGTIDIRDMIHAKALIAGYYQENASLKAEVEEYKRALEHILEYWNGNENDRAMNDAFYHILDTAVAALSDTERGKTE